MQNERNVVFIPWKNFWVWLRDDETNEPLTFHPSLNVVKINLTFIHIYSLIQNKQGMISLDV